MLINRIFKQLILYISLFCSFNIFADVVYSNHVDRIDAIRLTGATDATQFLSAIFTKGTVNITICGNKSNTYDLGRINYIPIIPYLQSYTPSSAHRQQNLFDMGFMGLGLGPQYVTYFINQPGEMANSVSGVPRTVGVDKQTLWSGSIANNNRGFSWAYQTFIYKSAERIEPGIYQIPEKTLYIIECYDTSGNLQEHHTFKSSAFQITSTVTSCTPAQSSKIIQMNSIPIATVENLSVGSLFGTKQQNFSLNCDPNVRVLFSVSDLLDPSNIGGTVATLESGGATGVGYIVSSPNSSFPNGYTFSPVGVSAANAPDVTYYNIAGGGIAGSAPTNVVDHTLNFSYIKTSEEVTEGKANAIIGITYSYQ